MCECNYEIKHCCNLDLEPIPLKISTLISAYLSLISIRKVKISLSVSKMNVKFLVGYGSQVQS